MNRSDNFNNDRYFGLSPRIVKWKSPSNFENSLADIAGKSRRIKTLYSQYYKELNPDYWSKGKEIAHTLFYSQANDYKDVDFDTVYDDMVYCLHRYGLSFQDYCIYNLIEKSEQKRNEFVSDKLRYHYCDILNAPDVYQLMTDKYTCYSVYGKYFKREICPLFKTDDIPQALRFISTHHNVIFKPLNEHSGHGIKKISDRDEDLLISIENLAAKTPGILEEYIVQGNEMNILNPGAVNTCRVVTFTIGSDVTIIGATLRMGVGDSITDNAGAGGIFASIDIESGIIKTDAKNYNNYHYLFHPSTGTKIIGFQLPHWDEARELITDMALNQLGTTLISWDIAFSYKGWCMVEANDNGDWSLIQANSEVGRKDELYSLMDRYFNTLQL